MAVSGSVWLFKICETVDESTSESWAGSAACGVNIYTQVEQLCSSYVMKCRQRGYMSTCFSLCTDGHTDDNDSVVCENLLGSSNKSKSIWSSFWRNQN